MLENADKKELLRLARNTLDTYLDRGSVPEYKTDRSVMIEKKGAFVSLHSEGELRGCIGQLDPDRKLYSVVQYCVLSAAFDDPRFAPVRREELDGLEIEISVLTPFSRIRTADEINVGKHGLYIVQGLYRGLLLPQVATEYGWDRDTFLRQTCFKAGLPETAWKDPNTEIYTFEAEVFSESEFPVPDDSSR